MRIKSDDKNVIYSHAKKFTHGSRGKVYSCDDDKFVIKSDVKSGTIVNTRKKRLPAKEKTKEKHNRVHDESSHQNGNNDNNNNNNDEDEAADENEDHPKPLTVRISNASSVEVPKDKTIHPMAFVSLFFASWAIILSSVLSW